MLAPVLSFTIEEAWKANPLTKDSVFISQLSDDTFVDLEIQSKWDKLLDVRDQVLKEIEVKRKMKIIGNSLEAKVGLTCDDSEMGFLNDNLELIKKVLIVSELNGSKG